MRQTGILFEYSIYFFSNTYQKELVKVIFTAQVLLTWRLEDLFLHLIFQFPDFVVIFIDIRNDGSYFCGFIEHLFQFLIRLFYFSFRLRFILDAICLTVIK